MSNNVKRKVNQTTAKQLNGWDTAIRTAERQLSAVNQRAAGLRQVISDFKRMQKEGMLWPADAGQEEAAQR